MAQSLVWRRILGAMLLLAMLGHSAPMWAAEGEQTQANTRTEEQRHAGLVKIIAGLSLASAGAVVVATSHGSGSVAIPGAGTISASATNKGAMVAGLGMIGCGVALISLGAKERSAASSGSNVTLGVALGARSAIFLRRQW